MEDDIKNYLPTVMFRGTLCMQKTWNKFYQKILPQTNIVPKGFIWLVKKFRTLYTLYNKQNYNNL